MLGLRQVFLVVFIFLFLRSLFKQARFDEVVIGFGGGDLVPFLGSGEADSIVLGIATVKSNRPLVSDALR